MCAILCSRCVHKCKQSVAGAKKSQSGKVGGGGGGEDGSHTEGKPATQKQRQRTHSSSVASDDHNPNKSGKTSKKPSQVDM